MITTVGTTDALVAAVRVAQAGMRSLTPSRRYSMVALGNVNPSGMVTITSLDPGHPAVIAGIGLSNDSNLTFSNLEVTSKGGVVYAVSMGSVTNVHLDNLNIHGPAATGDGSGVLIQNSKVVTVTNSDPQRSAPGSPTWRWRPGCGSPAITCTTPCRTPCTAAVPPTSPSAATPSAISWGRVTRTPSVRPAASAHDITISDNTITRGSGAEVQGVFWALITPISRSKNVTITATP